VAEPPPFVITTLRAETGDCAFARIADSYTNAGFEMSSLTSSGTCSWARSRPPPNRTARNAP
jgi:hypothetical protein